jgi:hypothetical protein
LFVTVVEREFVCLWLQLHSVRATEHTAFLPDVIVLAIDYNIYGKHTIMKLHSATLSLALLVSLGSFSTASQAGCLKGAVVGGVAGHVAGKHSVLGAAAGCAVGHHMSKKKAKEQAAADARAREQQRQANAAPQRR